MKRSEPLNLWLIANPAIVREGWTLIIDKSPALELYESSTYEEARERAGQPGCDVAIVDLDLDQESCWALIRHLKSRAPDLPVLVAASDPPVNSQALQRAGADKFILHSGSDGQAITEALESFFEAPSPDTDPVRV